MLELKDLGAFELAVAQTDAEQLVAAANTALESASTFTVTDADSFDDATKIAGRIKSIEKQVEELTEPAIKAAHERHRALTNARGAILTKLTTARAAINKRALDWRTEQQRREAEAQRERERIAREQAEAERKRIEDERLQAAMEAERLGDAKSAEAIMSAPPPVVEPVAVVSGRKCQSQRARQFGPHTNTRSPTRWRCRANSSCRANRRSRRASRHSGCTPTSPA